MDREKVIKELDKLVDEVNPWKESPPLRCDIPYPLLCDALALLKEQEAVEPKVSSTEQRCGNCNKVIEMDGWIACPWCGKPIAWNEWWKAVKWE